MSPHPKRIFEPEQSSTQSPCHIGCPEQASALLEVDFGADKIRMVGNIARDRLARLYHQMRGDIGEDLSFRDLPRGDAQIAHHSIHFFTGNIEGPKRNIGILIPGLSIQQLDQDSKQAELNYNRQKPSGMLPALVQALTLDGNGGKLDWSEDGTPSPCAWFFLERCFVKTPGGISVPILRGKRGARKSPDYSEWNLPNDFKRTQETGFNRWLETQYLPRAKACHTHCPFTESYFLQLQNSRLGRDQKDELGAAFFGNHGYQVLKGNRRQIAANHR